jgi:AbiU2
MWLEKQLSGVLRSRRSASAISRSYSGWPVNCDIAAYRRELWQELAWVYRIWAKYVALFGTKESRVVLLNDAAPAFTRMVQDCLWDAVILHIARLTDPPKSAGKANLSVRALEAAVTDAVLKANLTAAVRQALHASEFCRDLRNRRLAHRDLDLALKVGAEPLKPASRLMVKEALSALTEVLNVLSRQYFESTTIFDLDVRVGGGPGGALQLLYYVNLGLEVDRTRTERLRQGHFDPNAFPTRDL